MITNTPTTLEQLTSLIDSRISNYLGGRNKYS